MLHRKLYIARVPHTQHFFSLVSYDVLGILKLGCSWCPSVSALRLVCLQNLLLSSSALKVPSLFSCVGTYSLEHLSATLPIPVGGLSSTTVGDFLNTPPPPRRHSDIAAPRSLRQPPSPPLLQSPHIRKDAQNGCCRDDVDMEDVRTPTTTALVGSLRASVSCSFGHAYLNGRINYNNKL